MSNPSAPSAAGRGPVGFLMSQPYLLMVLATMFWGANILAAKFAVGQIDPYTLVVFRWVGALGIVAPLAIRHLRRDAAVLRKGWPILVFYGATAYATFNILYYNAAYHTSGVNISLEQASIPILVMVGNFAFFRVRVVWWQMVGVALTIVGVLVTATHGDLARLRDLTINTGDLMMLGASLTYAIYNLTLKYRPGVHWLSFLFVSFAGALITSLVYQLLFGGGFGRLVAEIPAITPQGWAAALYIAIFPSVLAQLFYARGVDMIGPNRASVFINVVPVFGTLLSILVLDEALLAYHLWATALVAVGIVLAEYAARARLRRQ